MGLDCERNIEEAIKIYEKYQNKDNLKSK